MKIFIFVFLILFFNIIQSEKIILTDLYQSNIGYLISLKLKSFPTFIFQHILLESNFSIIDPYYINLNNPNIKSTIIKKEKLENINEVYLLNQQITLNNIEETKVLLYLFSGNQDNFNESLPIGIGLTFHFDNEKFSLIHQLYNSGFINSKKFYFVPPKMDIKGELFIGGIPKEKLENKYKSRCFLIKNSKKWTCDLNKIHIIINETIDIYNPINETITFTSNFNNIIAPQNFITFLKKKYINKLLDNGKCFNRRINAKKGNNFKIACKCEILLDEIFYISFFLNNYEYKLSIDELIQYDHGLCELLINGEINRTNQWIIGSLFYNKHIIEFNYESKSITFYTNYKIKYNGFIDIDNISITKNLFKFLICFLLFFIIIQFIIKSKIIEKNIQIK